MIDRYSNPEIKAIWELENKYRIWLDIEVLACEARAQKGLIPPEDMRDIKEKARFNLEEVLEIESRVHHDVIAFLTNVADYVGPASRHIHYGLTSSDIGDTCLCYQLTQATDILLSRLDELIAAVKKQALAHKMTPCIGRSHGIHAEPTTLGLKFAHFYTELTRDRERLIRAREEIAVGKLSGAVGTFSNLEPYVEEFVLEKMGLSPAEIATQVINRDRHAYYHSVLAVIAGSLDRFATEIRLLQKTETREVEEPFMRGQKGSSAMPHKRNPIICERISGLSRVIKGNAQAALHNMALWHERDISHSGAERVILPDSTIALEYILGKMKFVVENLHVYPDQMEADIWLTRGLIFSQKLLLFLTRQKITREEAYAIVQDNAMAVWNDKDKTLLNELKKDDRVKELLDASGMAEMEAVFQVEPYLDKMDFLFKRAGLE